MSDSDNYQWTLNNFRSLQDHYKEEIIIYLYILSSLVSSKVKLKVYNHVSKRSIRVSGTSIECLDMIFFKKNMEYPCYTEKKKFRQ